MKLFIFIFIFIFPGLRAISSELYVHNHTFPKKGDNRFLVSYEIQKEILKEFFSIKQKPEDVVYILDTDKSNTVTNQDVFIFQKEAELYPDYLKDHQNEFKNQSKSVNVEILIKLMIKYNEKIIHSNSEYRKLISIELQNKINKENYDFFIFDNNGNKIFDEENYYWLCKKTE